MFKNHRSTWGAINKLIKKKKIPGDGGERNVVGKRRRRRRGGSGGKKKRIESERGRGSEKGCVSHC